MSRPRAGSRKKNRQTGGGRYGLPAAGPSDSASPGSLSKTPARSAAAAGVLSVVATPIGNLDDLSPRAKAVLANSDLILAEDTRHFRNLAQHFGIECKVRSYHDHNEAAAAGEIVAAIKSGVNAAIVSDAGTPTINDPGYRLINLCHEHEIAVQTVPGPCAFIAALSVSGFETHRFQFEGYVPPKGNKRREFLSAMIEAGCTAIAYETPHRLVSTLETIASLSPGHHICVARELTKMHEEVLRGPVEEILEQFKSRGSVRGEIVLLVRGKSYFQSLADGEVGRG